MKSNATLLEKALATPTNRRRKVTSEEIELAVAWARNEISLEQVNKVLNGKKQAGPQPYVRLAIALREYVRNL